MDVALTKVVRYLGANECIKQLKTRAIPTKRGTSLLIMSCTTVLRLVLFEKFTRYLREKVRFTCWLSSMRTAFSGMSLLSSSVSSFPDLRFLDEPFLAFFDDLSFAFQGVRGAHRWDGRR